jgi:hypothetical protein
MIVHYYKNSSGSPYYTIERYLKATGLEYARCKIDYIDDFLAERFYEWCDYPEKFRSKHYKENNTKYARKTKYGTLYLPGNMVIDFNKEICVCGSDYDELTAIRRSNHPKWNPYNIVAKKESEKE